jgi:GMP synthase (glutamine-hydrolysing)
MSDKVLLILHQKHSVPGRVGSLLQQRGYELEYCRPCVSCRLPDHLDGYAGVVVYGGPMSANDCQKLDGIKRELSFLEMVLREKVPFLGICLGGQMLARVLGGKVAPHPDGRVEVGYHKIRPTAAGADWFRHSEFFYQWHREGFTTPATATLLAEGEHFSDQCFCYGDAAVGTQFHPEITLDMIERWSTHAAHRLGRPGAQPKWAHLKGHELFDAGIERWTLDLFDRLGLHDRKVAAQAAE